MLRYKYVKYKNILSIIFIFLTLCIPSNLMGENEISKERSRKVKYCFIDRRGKMVIPPIYDCAYGFSEGFAAVEIRGKWGFIDKMGKMVIEPRFDAIHGNCLSVYYGMIPGFHEGLACVKSGDKWGYIDPKGKFIIEPKYDDDASFSEGLAPVTIDSKEYLRIVKIKSTMPDPNSVLTDDVKTISRIEEYEYYLQGYINKTGELVIQPQFHDAGQFYDGIAVINNLRPVGMDPNVEPCLLNRESREIVPIERSLGLRIGGADSFSEGLAAVEMELDYETWGMKAWQEGYVDSSGTFVTEPDYNKIADCLYVSDGFIDKKGKYVYKMAQQLSLDNKQITFANFGWERDKWGYVDKSGKFVIEPQFRYAASFSEGLASVTGGYIDKSGKYVIRDKEEFRSCGSFREGLALCAMYTGEEQFKYIGGYGIKWGYIDKTGKFVIEPKYDKAQEFSEGLAFVCIEKELYFIDKSGEIAFKCDFNKDDICEIYKFSESFSCVGLYSDKLR